MYTRNLHLYYGLIEPKKKKDSDSTVFLTKFYVIYYFDTNRNF